MIRRIPFEFPENLDPILIVGQPEESFLNIGLSLLLPYLEPYLIRSLHEARARVRDPALLDDIDKFNGQEGQHCKQHIRLNESVRLAGFPKLKALEEELDSDYRRFTATRSLRFNLAYAEGFEAFTMAFARYGFEMKAFDRFHDPAVRDMLRWHMIEELEHRTVAFEVYDHVFGGWFYRLAVGLFAQWHMNRWILRVAVTMLRTDRDVLRETYGGRWQAWKRIWPQIRAATRRLLPKVLATYSPWYSPRKIAMPAEAQRIAEHYSRIAVSSSPTASSSTT
jgi:predicted metal-dependent hydrolase